MDAWPTTLEQARAEQERLRARVVAEDRLGAVRAVAGVDAGYEGDEALAAVVVLAFPSLEPLDYATARRRVEFPYVAGYLSFREAPAVLDALEALCVRPDLLVCDGQGLAHPRRFGVACHLGVLADLPSIGCAKSLFVGAHGPLAEARGAHAPLVDEGEEVGAVLRTQTAVKPVYVSVGHRVSLATSLRFILDLSPRFRLPETTRASDGLASRGRVPALSEAARRARERAR